MNCETYPSRQEREKIVERRVDLLQKFLPIMASGESEAVVDERLKVLAAEHGQADLKAVLRFVWREQAFKEITQHMTAKQRKQARYREYLSSYMRFGGDRPFLRFNEFHRELNVHEQIVCALRDGATMSVATADAVNRQCDALMTSLLLWEDITSENPPTCLPPEVAHYP